MGFSRQEYWSGLPFPSPGDLPDPGIKPASPALAGRFFTTEPPGKPTRISYVGLKPFERSGTEDKFQRNWGETSLIQRSSFVCCLHECRRGHYALQLHGMCNVEWSNSSSLQCPYLTYPEKYTLCTHFGFDIVDVNFWTRKRVRCFWILSRGPPAKQFAVLRWVGPGSWLWSVRPGSLQMQAPLGTCSMSGRCLPQPLTVSHLSTVRVRGLGAEEPAPPRFAHSPSRVDSHVTAQPPLMVWSRSPAQLPLGPRQGEGTEDSFLVCLGAVGRRAGQGRVLRSGALWRKKRNARADGWRTRLWEQHVWRHGGNSERFVRRGEERPGCQQGCWTFHWLSNASWLLIWVPDKVTHDTLLGFPGGSDSKKRKKSACDAGDKSSIPGPGRCCGEGNGNLLQCSCLDNPMDRGAWRATVHGVAENQTWLSTHAVLWARPRPLWPHQQNTVHTTLRHMKWPCL